MYICIGEDAILSELSCLNIFSHLKARFAKMFRKQSSIKTSVSTQGFRVLIFIIL